MNMTGLHLAMGRVVLITSRIEDIQDASRYDLQRSIGALLRENGVGMLG